MLADAAMVAFVVAWCAALMAYVAFIEKVRQ
jgi:hypothetical protein